VVTFKLMVSGIVIHRGPFFVNTRVGSTLERHVKIATTNWMETEMKFISFRESSASGLLSRHGGSRSSLLNFFMSLIRRGGVPSGAAAFIAFFGKGT
jgi:hypothetical protein